MQKVEYANILARIELVPCEHHKFIYVDGSHDLCVVENPLNHYIRIVKYDPMTNILLVQMSDQEAYALGYNQAEVKIKDSVAALTTLRETGQIDIGTCYLLLQDNPFAQGYLANLDLTEIVPLLDIPENMVDSLTIAYENPDRLSKRLCEGFITGWKATDRNGFTVRLYKEYEF